MTEKKIQKILSDTARKNRDNIKKVSKGIWVVIWNKYSTSFDAEKLSDEKDDSGEDFECLGNFRYKEYGLEVIGNIYENPEVLSNSSPPVRTSDRKSDFDKSKEFNTDLKEVQK